MILTCPQCEMRYILPATVLGADGRHVKCTNCEEIWHQLPDADELAEFEPDVHEAIDEAMEEIVEEETGEAAEDIPDAVKPVPEGSSVPALPEEEVEPSAKLSYAIAASIFILTFGIFLGMNKSILRAWPESIAFYNFVGLADPVSAEGVIFDRVKAEIKYDHGKEVVALSGKIINLTNHSQMLPVIEASLRNASGSDLDHWFIELPETYLDAEGSLPFKSEFKSASHGADNVNLRFVLKAKTDVKGGGNTQAPHQDDQAH